jgi:hypothetical protein
VITPPENSLIGRSTTALSPADNGSFISSDTNAPPEAVYYRAAQR